MTIEVALRHGLGDFTLDISFTSDGGVMALFGASGSGKSTVVNLIAGLMRPDAGRIAFDGRVLVDTQRRVFVPPHRRRIGYVFQDARLFPHLSVEKNLTYGRFFTPRAKQGADFATIVKLLGISHLLSRRPASLSGGERQRVAIGRALMASPSLVLMDEPLASLDDARKAEILPYLERLRDESSVPIVYVSHSVAEVARLATDVVMMANGRIEAQGPPAEVLARRDLLPAAERAEAGASLTLTVLRHDAAYGLTVLASRGGEWRLPEIPAHPGARVRVRVRSRDVMIASERPVGISAVNVLPATIAAIEPSAGHEARIVLDCAGDRLVAAITRRSVDTLSLAPGRAVFAVVKAVALDG